MKPKPILIIGLFYMVCIFVPFRKAQAGLFFNPYLGYGQGNLELGDEYLVGGKISGYLLGLRVGFDLGKTLLLAFDYSRMGPIDYKLEHAFGPADAQMLSYNMFSGGIWVGIDFRPLMLFGGYYPYNVLAEYTHDMRFTGPLRRWGLGFKVGAKFEIQFIADTADLTGDSISNANRSILCSRGAASCEPNGTIQVLSFAISGALN